MNIRTHKSSINLMGAILFIVSISLMVGISSAANAGQYSGQRYAEHEVACFVFGTAAGIKDVQIHAGRVKINSEDPEGIAYVLGYHTGALDVYGSANTNHYGSYEKSRKAAGREMYKQFKCTTAEAI